LSIYIADFFCYKLKLVIEVDGSVHNDEEANKRCRKTKIIESEGIKVLFYQ
jgi:very-short-patch-repair endonuclease